MGETVEGDLTGSLERAYESGDNDGPVETTTAPRTMSIRAAFRMTVQSPQ